MALSHLVTAIVTGSFSFTGRYVALHLLDQGVSVRTLTHHPGQSDPLGGRAQVDALDFSEPDGLRGSMEGAHVLYNVEKRTCTLRWLPACGFTPCYCEAMNA